MRCSSRYFCKTVNSFHDISYRSSNDGVFSDSSSILRSYSSWCEVSLSAFFFSKMSIKSWYSSETRDQESTYDFRFSVFSMSFMIIANISWSCFHASIMNDAACIWHISSSWCQESRSEIMSCSDWLIWSISWLNFIDSNLKSVKLC